MPKHHMGEPIRSVREALSYQYDEDPTRDGIMFGLALMGLPGRKEREERNRAYHQRIRDDKAALKLLSKERLIEALVFNRPFYIVSLLEKKDVIWLADHLAQSMTGKDRKRMLEHLGWPPEEVKTGS